ncbi:hypothetical protein CYCD_26230 [Tenuifilaceae bacterium CYCD]|nr:hypothetical protein CYCD_26230 [Tenuifilaceae bacterium CYCD]
MKQLSLTIAGVLLAVIVTAQNADQRELPFFNKVKVSGEIKVFLEKGDREMATVNVSEILASDVILEVADSILEIKLKKNSQKKAKAEVYVKYTDLKSISVAAAAYVSLNDTLKVDNLQLSVITNSEFDSDIIANTIDVKVGQGSSVRLRGTVQNYEATVNTKGILSALELKTDSAFVTVGTGAIAKIYAKELIEANVRPAGNLTYTGNPMQKNIKTSIGSSVREE